MKNFGFSTLLDNKRRLFWLLQFSGWSGYSVLKYITGVFHGAGNDYAWVVALFAASGMLLTLLMRQIYLRIWHWRPWRIGLSILLSAFFFGFVWQTIRHWVFFWFYPDCEGCSEHLATIIKYTAGAFYVLLTWSVLYFAIKYYRMLERQRAMTLKATGMAHEAQLKMLRYQLNPHFLFNTLNAISTLILEQQTASANHMVSRLSAFLRYSLDNDPMQRTTLAEELDATRLYLDIEHVRFGERLRVDIKTSETAQRALVPSLLLQPLIENAIKYAVAPSEDGGEIYITAKTFGDELLIALTDNGPGLKQGDGKSQRGVGLRNARERLATLYGESFDFNLGAAQPHGLVVNIRIPLEFDD